MTDSRAALEEAAEKFWQEKHAGAKGNVLPMTTLLADFAEWQLAAFAQESSSLKLLLSAICRGRVEVRIFKNPPDASLFVMERPDGDWRAFHPVELDSSGIPVLTEEILKALEAAK